MEKADVPSAFNGEEHSRVGAWGPNAVTLGYAGGYNNAGPVETPQSCGAGSPLSLTAHQFSVKLKMRPSGCFLDVHRELLYYQDGD